MEHCEVGDLFRGYFQPNFEYEFPQTEVLKIVGQIATGLCAAHNKGIVHRDLSAGNILLTKDGVIKIGDFGQAKNLTEYIDGREALTGEGIGTRGYKAPEILDGMGDYGAPADIWSLGCITHLICTKTRWFDHRPDEMVAREYIRRIKTERHSALPADVYDEGMREMVDKMLEKDPDDRPSAEDLIEMVAELLPNEENDRLRINLDLGPNRQQQSSEESNEEQKMNSLTGALHFQFTESIDLSTMCSPQAMERAIDYLSRADEPI